MARALECMQKSRSFHFKKMLEAPARHARNLIFDSDECHASKTAADRPLEQQTGASSPLPQPTTSAQSSNSAQYSNSAQSSQSSSRPGVSQAQGTLKKLLNN